MVEYDIGVPYNSDTCFTYNLGKPPPDMANIPYSYNPGNLQVFGTDGFAVDKDIRIDDSRIGSNILWSSDKQQSLINHPGEFGNFATFDGKGGLFDSKMSTSALTRDVMQNMSGQFIDNITQKAVTEATSQATSTAYQQILPMVNQHVSNQLGNKLDTVNVYTVDNFPIFSPNGQLTDSNVSVSQLTQDIANLSDAFENQTSDTTQLVQTTVDAQMQKLLVQQTVQLNETSRAMQEKMTIADQTLYTDLTKLYTPQVTMLQESDSRQQQQLEDMMVELDGKINLVSPSTSGNVPILDVNGSLIDSQFPLTDLRDCATRIDSIFNQHQLQTQQLQDLSMDMMQLQPTATSGNVSVFDALGQVVDTGVSLKTIVSEIEELKQDIDASLFVPTTFASNEIPVFDINGQLQSSGVDIGSFMPKNISAPVNTLAQFQADGTVQSSGLRFSDGTVSADVIWSSQQQVTALDTKINRPLLATAGHVALFTSDGQVVDGGLLPVVPPYIPPMTANTIVMFDANGKPTETSIGVDQLVTKILPSYRDNLATWSADGQLQDGMIGIDDNSIASSSVLWTSLKSQELFDSRIPTVPAAMAENISIFDNKGHVVDSGTNIYKLVSDVDASIPRMMNVTQLGQLPQIAADGGIEDSGVSINDVQKRTRPRRVDNVASLDTNGMVTEIYSVDDSSINNTNLWTSDRTMRELDGKLQQPTFFTNGNVPMFDTNGQLVDSSTSVTEMINMVVDRCKQDCGTYLKPVIPIRGEDTLAALNTDGTLRDTQLLTSQIMTVKKPIVAGSIGLLDSSGQIFDSGVMYNDTDAPSTNVAWSSQKTTQLVDGKLSKVTFFSAGNLPVFDATGQLIDSTTSVTDLNRYVDTQLATQAVHPVVPGQPNVLALWDFNGQQIDSNIPINNVMMKMQGNNTLARLDNNGQVQSTGVTIDDTLNAQPSVLWSSSRHQTSLGDGLMTKLNTVEPYTLGTVPMFGLDGQLSDSGIEALALRAKLSVEHQPILVPAKSGNLASLNENGFLQDSGFTFDDGITSASSVQSSMKTQSLLNTKMNLSPLSVKGNVSVFDDNGQVIDGAVSLASLLPQPVIPTVTGNLASLTSDGQFQDSQIQPNSLLTKPGSSIQGHLPVFDVNNQIKDSMMMVDDSAVASPQILWSSDKILQTTSQVLLKPNGLVTSGNVPVFDADSQLRVSSVPLNELATLSKVAADYQIKQAAVTGNMASWNASGQTIDSNVRLDDNSTPGANVLYSSMKINNLKVDKPVTYVSDDIVIFGDKGQLKDSGTSIASLMNNVSSLMAANTNTSPTVADSLVIRSASGALSETSYRINDFSAPESTVLWTSNKTQALAPPIKTTSIAVLDERGQVKSSEKILDDSVAPSANVIWSSEKCQAQFGAPKPFYFGTVGNPGTDNGKLLLRAVVGNTEVSGGNTFVFPKTAVYRIDLRVENADGLNTYKFHLNNNAGEILLSMYYVTTNSGHTITSAKAGDTLYFTVSKSIYMGTKGEYCVTQL